MANEQVNTIHVTGKAAAVLQEMSEKAERYKKQAASMLEKHKEGITWTRDRAVVGGTGLTLGYMAGRFSERWEKGVLGATTESVIAGACYAVAFATGGATAEMATAAGDAALSIATYELGKEKGRDASSGPLADRASGPLAGAQGHGGLSAEDIDFLNRQINQGRG